MEGTHDNSTATDSTITSITNCKDCKHLCDLSPSIRQCCSCSDHGALNIKYIDGIGATYCVFRYENYCPVCKNRCKQADQNISGTYSNYGSKVTVSMGFKKSKEYYKWFNFPEKNNKSTKKIATTTTTPDVKPDAIPATTNVTTSSTRNKTKKRSTLPTLNTIEESKIIENDLW